MEALEEVTGRDLFFPSLILAAPLLPDLSISKGYWQGFAVYFKVKCLDLCGCNFWVLGSSKRKMFSMQLLKIRVFDEWKLLSEPFCGASSDY